MFHLMPLIQPKPFEVIINFKKCAFLYCNNGAHTGHKLFRFPLNQKRLRTWLYVIGNPFLFRYSIGYLTKKAGVCKNHFYPDSFKDTEQTKLHQCAVPTKFHQPLATNYYPSAFNLFDTVCSNNYLRTEMEGNVNGNNYLHNEMETNANQNNAYANGMVSNVNHNNMNINNYSYTGMASNVNHNVCNNNFPVRYSNELLSSNDVTSGPSSSVGSTSNFNPADVLSNFQSITYGATEVGNSQVRNSADTVISDDMSESASLNEKIKPIEQQIGIDMRKLTANAQSKRDNLHYFVQLVKRRKRDNAQFNIGDI